MKGLPPLVSREPHLSLQCKLFAEIYEVNVSLKVQGLFETLAYSHACLCCNVVTLVPVPSLFYMQVYKTYNHVPLSFRVKWSF